MSSALDEFERSLVAASRALHAEQTARTQAQTTPAELPRRNRWLMRRLFHRRLLVSLAALVIAAGGVAAASSVLFPSQRLANGRLNCFMATHGTGALDHRTLAVGDARPNGQPPIDLCRMWYRLNRYRLNGSTTGPLVADLPLTACQESVTTVGVYVATGRPDQCRRLGEKPLPATYAAAAAARLRTLQHALLALQNAHDCIAPATLARQARAVLASQGFSGWRLITPPPDPGKHWLFGYALPAGAGGACGKLTGNPSSTIDIDTQRHLVTESVGPPRSIAVELNRIEEQLGTTTLSTCFTPTSIRTLVRRAFAGTPLRPRFAIVAAQRGVTFGGPSQRLYDDGCVRFFLAIPSNDNRFVDVLLNARNAPQLPAGEVYPPASSFHP
jgi:hypothetical protein